MLRRKFLLMHMMGMVSINTEIFVIFFLNHFELRTGVLILQIVLYKCETCACNFMLIKLEGYDMFEWLGI